MNKRLSGIKTNVLTGFLGAGKSTAILSLLQQKPVDERWAVLVNEFGEVGIDGGLLSARHDSNVFVREVPGGCMCCTAGLPMQMAMNMLLARARPDRLIIEPTGLGHPKEVIGTLSTEHYQDLLDIRSTLTLVDARKVANERYTQHSTFNEQLDVADVIVASKSDLYGDADFANLKQYLRKKGWLPERQLHLVRDGNIEIDWLQRAAKQWPLSSVDDGKSAAGGQSEPAPPIFPPEGFIRLSNAGEGFTSFGWIFDASFEFDLASVSQLIESSGADRIKALLKTDKGERGCNYAGDTLKVTPLSDLADSRIEIIVRRGFSMQAFEERLLMLSTQS